MRRAVPTMRGYASARMDCRIREAAIGVGVVAALALPATAQAAAGDFTSGGSFPVGSTPYDIAVADFDGDGIPDAAVPNANGASLSVMLGDGLGRFNNAPGSPIATAPNPLGLVAGQFGGSTDTDLAVTQSSDDSVLLLIGRGDGRFRPATAGPTATGDGPIELVAADLNEDGDTDLAITNQSDDSVTVLLGDGSGFDEAATSPESVGDSPQDLVATDLNGGAPDLAVANSEAATVSILLSTGTGDFTAPITSPEALASNPIGIAAANLDAGGVRDLAVAAYDVSPKTHILLGNGLGDFAAAGTSPEADGSHDVLAADLDGDGDQDLAGANAFDGEIAIMLNNGSADFTAAPSSPEDVPGLPADLAVADLDGDTDQDLLVVGGNSDNIHSLLNDEPDGDTDGIADQADDCPAVAGPGGCPQLARTVSISYSKRRDAFKGVIAGDEEECQRGETVKIFRERSGGRLQRVGTDRTNQAGRYRVGEDEAHGRFYAEARPSLEPDLGICVVATSDTIRVR
jgi:hypothetical protein